MTELTEAQAKTPSRKRGRKVALTPTLAAALDRSKLSDRKAMYVLAETAKSMGVDINSLALNRSSIHVQRKKLRLELTSQVKADFKPDVPLVVHWDGKLLQDLTGNEHVDRLPVLVSGRNITKLLAVAKLPSGTGEAQAKAVHAALAEWDITSKVCGMCFDTTSSNTGLISGACTVLQQMLGKDLLSFACRHHIMELLVGAAFEACFGSTSGPEVLLFKRFKSQWGFIDLDHFESGIDDNSVSMFFTEKKDDILKFAAFHLQQQQPRDDYREFLELAIIYLGGTPSCGIRFNSPGAIHHARWMSKVLYSLKIFMFRNQFSLSAREAKGLKDFCMFAVSIYLKAWVTAPLPSSAPRNDLELLKAVLKYEDIHPNISKAVVKKLSNNLWYLSEELAALALFDSEVETAVKREMVSAMKEEDGLEEPQKRIKVDLKSLPDKTLAQFVTKQSVQLLEKLNLSYGFLDVDPEEWPARADYQEASDVIRSLKVVNDYAERGVALIQEYNGLLTHNEEQFQFLMQVVEQHRHMFPDCSKRTLAADCSSQSNNSN